ncbi:MAG: glycosyltransferase family 4 protein [Candidatus Hydrogenedentales bacterium]|jgi:glycosyltransferase involved in cell wall biosynthesis
MSKPVRVAYMTGEYLRVSPFVFIHREIAALRELGAEVETISVRGVSESECVSPEQRAERETTHILVPFSFLRLLVVLGRLKFGSPFRYFRALVLAMKTRQPGLKSFFYQLAYFIEAGFVVDYMRKRGLTHLHNHLADSSCTVAMLAAELGGFTFSFTLHGPGIFFEPDRWRLDAKFERAEFVACISHFCRSQAMIWTRPDRWDRLKIVHCGVDVRQYTPRTHEGTGKRLIFVGRLAAVKGVPVLLEAFAALAAKHPELTLTLAGDGPDRAWIEAFARERGIASRVTVTGYVSQERIRELLAQSDIFVMASFAEGVPVVLMEAMATGLPVVTTHIAGIPELVEDGVSGYLVPPGDCASLGARVESLLSDAALRTCFGSAGRAKVEAEFDSAKNAQALMELFADTDHHRLRPNCS